MKIEPQIELQPENKIQFTEKTTFNKLNSRCFQAEIADFESCIKELDETAQPQQEEPQNIISPEKTQKTPKISKKPPEEENIKVKADNLNDIKFFRNSKELFEKDDKTKINLDKFEKKDIDFFKICCENPAVSINNINAQNFQVNIAINAQDGQVNYKSFDVSKGLFNIIEYSFKSQKPVRLDFNGNSSVILKMNNSGKLVAELISSDQAMSYILKNSIPQLKNKLDEENLPYGDILYKDNSDNNKNKNNKGDNQ